MARFAPRPALLASNQATLDRFASLTEKAASAYLDTVPDSTTFGRVLAHAPGPTYSRTMEITA